MGFGTYSAQTATQGGRLKGLSACDPQLRRPHATYVALADG